MYEKGYNDAVEELKKTKKTAMEKELKIEVPKGYEIDRQKSTFEKIIFKKIPENPKTWEEYCKQTTGYVSYFFSSPNSIIKSWFEGSYNEFMTEERVKQFVALGKLLQLRDYWVKRSKFKDAIGIFTRSDGVIVADNCDINDCALTFPTQEMADKFITCFWDLIKQASPLV